MARKLLFDAGEGMYHIMIAVKNIMKRSLVAFIFTLSVVLAGALRAAQTNVTVVLTNQCQVTGFLVSQSDSNVVVSVGGGQRMTFAPSEISSLKLTADPVVKSRPAIDLAGSQPVSGGTRIMLALTNGSLVAGVLVSQSLSNFVVSTGGGQRTNIARSQVNWFELKESPTVAPQGAVFLTGAPQPARATSNSIAAEFNKPHTEDEMRAMLRTPEGAALLKSIRDQYIGSGADPQTKAASDSYFKTVQDFQNGKIGIAEIQSFAQSAFGNLSEHQPQSSEDPQAAQLNAYLQILQSFIAQPAPAPVHSAQ